MKVLKFVISLLGVKIVDMLMSVSSCLQEFFSYRKQCILDEKEKSEERKDEEFIEKAEKIAN